MQHNIDLYESLLTPLLQSLVAVILGFCIKWLQTHLGATRAHKLVAELDTKKSIALIAVQAVRHLFPKLDPINKFQETSGRISIWAKDHHIEITPDEINDLVVWAAQELKDQFLQQLSKANVVGATLTQLSHDHQEELFDFDFSPVKPEDYPKTQ